MRIKINNNDVGFLRERGIVLREEYTEKEAFDLLNSVYDIETQYAQQEDKNGARRLARIYAGIADRIQEQIPA